jgi:hypothetical protein
VSAFDRLERFAASRAAVALMGAWAMAEAIVLPVVPDVGLCLLVLAAPWTAPRLFAAVVAGGLVGTTLLAAISGAAPDATRAMLLALPGIHPATLADVGATLTRDGIAGFGQLGPGAPLKVYTDAWVNLDGGLFGLFAGTILNRLTRIGPTLLVAAALGWPFAQWIRRHERLTILVYAGFWLAVYVLYLG